MKVNFIPYIYILFFLGNFTQVNSQGITLKISTKDTINHILISKLPYAQKHNSEISILRSLDSIKEKLERRGFLNHTLDTIYKTDTTYSAILDLKTKTNIVRIFCDSSDLNNIELGKITGSNDNFFEISISETTTFLNEVVKIFDQQGKSFTKVSLKDISIKNNIIEAYLNIEKSESRKMDKVIVNGYTDFPKQYLKNNLNLKKNTLISTVLLDELSHLIATLPFVSEVKPPEVLFTKDSTHVYLYLKKEPSNKFDGVLGFSSNEKDNGLSLNGYLDLSLSNLFNSGETFSLFWKNSGNERQFFDLSLELPYVFKTRLTPMGEINIFKQDSTFANTNLKFSLSHIINSKSEIGGIIASENSSNLLSNGVSNGINDFKSIHYGIRYLYDIPSSNNFFNNKFSFYTELLTGTRKIEDNPINQYKFFVKTKYIWSINNRNFINVRNETGGLFSDDDFLTNEIFRIGGINSIRGFNEDEIFASTYSYFNLEYRYVANDSSYLYTITDLGYINNEIRNLSSRVFSVGLGYTFTSKLGLINMSYAIGKFEDNPMTFNNSRLHLKIINFF